MRDNEVVRRRIVPNSINSRLYLWIRVCWKFIRLSSHLVKCLQKCSLAIFCNELPIKYHIIPSSCFPLHYFPVNVILMLWYIWLQKCLINVSCPLRYHSIFSTQSSKIFIKIKYIREATLTNNKIVSILFKYLINPSHNWSNLV